VRGHSTFAPGYDFRAMAQLRFPRPLAHGELRYVREPEPIHFPEGVRSHHRVGAE
jgi:hypothetical protein